MNQRFNKEAITRFGVRTITNINPAEFWAKKENPKRTAVPKTIWCTQNIYAIVYDPSSSPALMFGTV